MQKLNLKLLVMLAFCGLNLHAAGSNQPSEGCIPIHVVWSAGQVNFIYENQTVTLAAPNHPDEASRLVTFCSLGGACINVSGLDTEQRSHPVEGHLILNGAQVLLRIHSPVPLTQLQVEDRLIPLPEAIPGLLTQWSRDIRHFIATHPEAITQGTSFIKLVVGCVIVKLILDENMSKYVNGIGEE